MTKRNWLDELLIRDSVRQRQARYCYAFTKEERESLEAPDQEPIGEDVNE